MLELLLQGVEDPGPVAAQRQVGDQLARQAADVLAAQLALRAVDGGQNTSTWGGE